MRWFFHALILKLLLKIMNFFKIVCFIFEIFDATMLHQQILNYNLIDFLLENIFFNKKHILRSGIYDFG